MVNTYIWWWWAFFAQALRILVKQKKCIRTANNYKITSKPKVKWNAFLLPILTKITTEPTVKYTFSTINDQQYTGSFCYIKINFHLLLGFLWMFKLLFWNIFLISRPLRTTFGSQVTCWTDWRTWGSLCSKLMFPLNGWTVIICFPGRTWTTMTSRTTWPAPRRGWTCTTRPRRRYTRYLSRTSTPWARGSCKG